MQGITILSTNETPEIILNPEGSISIKGRWIKHVSDDFSGPVLDWLEKYASEPAEYTCADIHLEYFNDFNSTVLISLIKKISSVICTQKKLLINWYYEEGDEDILERGENISSVLDIRFNFIETSDSDIYGTEVQCKLLNEIDE